MTALPANPQPIFVFDGDCGFCSACVRFAQRHVDTGARWVPWQRLDLRELGLSREQATESVQWVVPGQPAVAGPVAVAALLASSGPLWRVIGRVLGTRAVLLVAWPVYRLIARYRHRLPGGTPACALPKAT